MSTETLQKLVCREAVPTGQLVELLASHNPVVKQLTADYVAYTHASSGQEDLSLLVINLLARDCHDPNPAVAGSAVTALAALNTAPDAALTAILHTIDSSHQMVRRSATAACLAYTRVHPELALSSGLTDCLYSKLRDKDPLVVSNSLLALDRILQQEGGVVINKPIAHYLMARLSDFSQTSLETVLCFLKKYTPKDDKERFELLNPLDESFKTDDAAVLVAAVELFLHWMQPFPKLKHDLMTVIQPAFCRIFISSSSEICYLLAEFLASLGAEFIRDVFNPHYRYFSLNPNDPGCLKAKKLEIFGLIGLPVNVEEFISDIYPYCSDFNSYKQSINCLAVLGQISENGKEQVYSILPELLDSSSDKIIAASLECLLTLVSCEPKFYSKSVNKSTKNVLEELSSNTNIDDPSNLLPSLVSSTRLTLPPAVKYSVEKALSRSVVTDQHPDLVLHTLAALPLALECCVMCLEQLQERQAALPPATQCLLIATAAKVFLHRPAQCYIILVRVLQAGCSSKDADVVAKATLIYAMLEQGPKLAATLINGV